MLKFKRNSCSEKDDSRQDFQNIDVKLAPWTESVFGQYILASEQLSIDRHLAATAGYRGMAVKVMASGFNIEAGPQLHKFVLAPFRAGDVTAQADADELPLPSDVVDVAVLHHVLDFSEYPHEALKESARVVQSSGHLIIVGFNPWSLFGLWRLLGSCFSSAPVWRCRCLSVVRIVDWLKFVGLEPEQVTYGAFKPPLKRAGLLRRLGFFNRAMMKLKVPLGDYYVIRARKMRLRPIRGNKQWLPSAIKPVKLASRTQIDKRKSPE